MTSHCAARRRKLPAVRRGFALRFAYDSCENRKLPHVVKFSGGRSSAMLLLGLLKARQLRPSRGDVVVFNNTSTESPATYRFVKIIQQITEERFRIPFFWTEFTTYEDASGGEWRRLAGYRLVKPRPYGARNMPMGYHRRGEVFEELVSWKQQLPNRFTRICTDFLKIHATALFLADWLGRNGGSSGKAEKTRHLGHRHRESCIDLARYGDRRDVAKFHVEQPVARREQAFRDYTKAPLTKRINPVLRGRVFDRRAVLQGEYAVPFVSVVGLRADEPHRVGRVLERNCAISEEKRFADGELVTAPLFDAGVTKEDVREFWAGQEFDLGLSHDLNQSNCVFCFMKGERELRRLAQLKPRRAVGPPTPDDVRWWQDLESRYARRVRSSDNSSAWTTFGFFGKNRLFFEELANGESEDKSAPFDALPCECTD